MGEEAQKHRRRRKETEEEKATETLTKRKETKKQRKERKEADGVALGLPFSSPAGRRKCARRNTKAWRKKRRKGTEEEKATGPMMKRNETKEAKEGKERS